MRVGFVLADIFTGSAVALWPSVASMFPEDGKDSLVIFPGGRLNSSSTLDRMKNSIYSLVSPDNLDGLIVWSSSLTGNANTEDVFKRFESMTDRPMVTMDGKAASHPNIPDVRFNAYEGSRALIQHCIDVHGARRIVYLRGPLSHNSAQRRFQAYVDVLAQNNIPYDERLVSEPGSWNQGGETLRSMIEERNILPGKDFDMIVCASDLMMYDAEQVLLSYGYVLGRNVFLCGFNDSVESRLTNVPATTVRLPYAGMGRHAVISLFSLFDGRRCFDRELATTPIFRRSCGCGDSMLSIHVNDTESLVNLLSTDFMISHEEARTVIERVASGPNEGNVSLLVDLLFSKGASTQEIIRIVSCFENVLNRGAVNELLRISYSLIPAILDRRVSRINFDTRNSRRRFNVFGNQLLETSDIEGIARVLDRNALDLGFSEIHLVYNDGSKSILYGPDPVEFPENQLVPDSGNILDPGVWIAAPLCSENEFMGYILMKTRTFDGSICEDIRGVVSSALKNAKLFAAAKEAQKTAEAAEFARSNFFANVGENLRNPLSEITEIIRGSDFTEDSKKALNEKLIGVKRTIDMSLIATGELELDCRCIGLSDILGTFDCYRAKTRLPYLVLDEKRFRRVLEIVTGSIGEGADLHATLERDGVHIGVSDSNGLWSPAGNPSLDYIQQIVLLHNGLVLIKDHGIEIIMPYPTLCGSTPKAIDSLSCIACIDGKAPFDMEGVSTALVTGVDLASKKRLPPNTGAIYWDPDFKGYNALTGILGLISNENYRKLPFISMDGVVSRTFEDSMRACVEAKGKVMLQIGSLPDGLLKWIQDPEIITCDRASVMSMFRRYNPRLAIIALDQYSDKAQSLDGILTCLRAIRAKYQEPVIVCSETIDQSLVDSLSAIPNVMLVNSCILESDEFAMRLRAVLGGAELLSPQTATIVKKAQLYLCQHATLPISRWQVAESVHTSEDYLTRVFKKQLGLSPWDYLNRYRVHLASSLLRNTGMSVNEVSIATGFQDQAYFCRVFKKVKGYSPIHLRSGRRK